MTRHKLTTSGRTKVSATDEQAFRNRNRGIVSGRAPDTTVDPAEELGETEGVIGIEHKIPLSEAVLRAVGLYQGEVGEDDPDEADEGTKESNRRTRALADSSTTTEDGTVVRDARDTEGAIFVAPPESPTDCIELHQAVRFMEAKFKGYFQRTPLRNGRVKVTLTYGEDAEVMSAAGTTTRDAVKSLAEKLSLTNLACFAKEG